MNLFNIQKIIKVSSIEKEKEKIDDKCFNQDLSQYLSHIKLSLMKKYETLKNRNLLFQCYIKNCTRAYDSKRELIVHLKKHVRFTFILSIAQENTNVKFQNVLFHFLIKRAWKAIQLHTLTLDFLNVKRTDA
jgi:hypothetical protein